MFVVECAVHDHKLSRFGISIGRSSVVIVVSTK